MVKRQIFISLQNQIRELANAPEKILLPKLKKIFITDSFLTTNLITMLDFPTLLSPNKITLNRLSIVDFLLI